MSNPRTSAVALPTVFAIITLSRIRNRGLVYSAVCSGLSSMGTKQ
jgi:hypothetical protein